MPTPEQIEAWVVDRVTGVVLEAEHQHSNSVAAWRETPVPFTVDGASAMYSHLLFSAHIQSMPNLNRTRSGKADDHIRVAADLRVFLLYETRAGSQVTDARAAHKAAREVLQAIMAQPNAADLSALGGDTFEIDVTNVGIASLTQDGSYTLIDQRYRVLFDYPLR